METQDQIQQLSEKMNQMEQILNQNLFANPLKDFQITMRNHLLEFKQIFMKNLSELNEYLSKNEVNTTSENVSELKTALEHKTYQVEILKKAFTDYEEASEQEIQNLKTENEKLKYRIHILIKTIEDMEKK